MLIIECRKGAVEVSNGIHAGHINLEIWMSIPETDLQKLTESYFNLEDEVQANVELELNKAAELNMIERL